jgi:hypothetical protein
VCFFDRCLALSLDLSSPRIAPVWLASAHTPRLSTEQELQAKGTECPQQGSGYSQAGHQWQGQGPCQEVTAGRLLQVKQETAVVTPLDETAHRRSRLPALWDDGGGNERATEGVGQQGQPLLALHLQAHTTRSLKASVSMKENPGLSLCSITSPHWHPLPRFRIVRCF